MSVPRITSVVALAAAALLALAGCSSAPTGQEAKEKPAAAAKAQYPVTVTDMAGNEVTIESADSVVFTDNRLFRLVADWGIDLSAAPRALMSPENPLKADESILDLGTHAEPDFEKVVEADPDLIVNGYRYGGHAEDMKKAAPDAAFIDMTNDELSTDQYLVDSVELLGEVFGKQDEAKAVIDDFHAAVAAAKDAYAPDTTVMGLVTSGNEIRYSSPKDGRGSSIFFDLVGLTPALQSEGSTNDKGDDISIEAIAQSDADFFLVLDREAAFADSESSPALELINSSSALATVPAVQNKAIYVMPDDFYLTEDIVAYTTVLDGLTKAFSA
jgi:iron complex transport system substrate-binding protein